MVLVHFLPEGSLYFTVWVTLYVPGFRFAEVLFFTMVFDPCLTVRVAETILLLPLFAYVGLTFTVFTVTVLEPMVLTETLFLTDFLATTETPAVESRTAGAAFAAAGPKTRAPARSADPARVMAFLNMQLLRCASEDRAGQRSLHKTPSGSLYFNSMGVPMKTHAATSGRSPGIIPGEGRQATFR